MHAQSYFRRIALVERVAFTGVGICRMRGTLPSIIDKFDLQISMHAQAYFRRIALAERVAFTGVGICRMRGSAQLPRRSVRTGTRSALTDAKAVGRSSATAW